MTFEDLRCISEIAAQESITKAAIALNISQPTLSQRLKKVESELNTELFSRSRFGQLAPTPSGKIFLAHSEEILKSLQTMQHEIRNCKGKHHYTMGIPIRNGFIMVKGLTEALATEHPEITIDYEDGYYSSLEKKTIDGEVDLSLVRMTQPNQNYRIFTIRHSRSVIRLRNSSPLWNKVEHIPGEDIPRIHLKDLAIEQFCSLPSPVEHRSRLLSDLVLSQLKDFDTSKTTPLPNLQICEEYAKTGIASYVCSDDNQYTTHENLCRLEDKYTLDYNFDLIAGPDMNIHDAGIIADILRKLRAQD